MKVLNYSQADLDRVKEDIYLWGRSRAMGQAWRILFVFIRTGRMVWKIDMKKYLKSQWNWY